MHRYFALLAEALNDAGLDMKAVLEPGVAIPWTPENVKNHLWRPLQEAYKGKESTTELDTKEVQEIYETLNGHLGTKLKVHVPWPSVEEIMLSSL